MRILTLDNISYEMNEIPDEVDDLRFAILDNSKLHKLIKTKKNFEISIGLKKTAQYYTWDGPSSQWLPRASPWRRTTSPPR